MPPENATTGRCQVEMSKHAIGNIKKDILKRDARAVEG